MGMAGLTSRLPLHCSPLPTSRNSLLLLRFRALPPRFGRLPAAAGFVVGDRSSNGSGGRPSRCFSSRRVAFRASGGNCIELSFRV